VNAYLLVSTDTGRQGGSLQSGPGVRMLLDIVARMCLFRWTLSGGHLHPEESHWSSFWSLLWKRSNISLVL